MAERAEIECEYRQCVLGTPESVGMNGQIDWQAQQIYTSGLQLGRVEVLRGLRNFLNMDRPEHHSTDRLKERGVEKGSGRQGREDLCSTRQILTLFRGQPWGDC